jgi:hypothetical protein
MSRLVDLYNSLICAHKKKNIMSCMATTTRTMVVELSHEVVVSFMRWLFREATISFSPWSFSSTSPKILCSNAWDDLWDCWRVPMYLLCHAVGKQIGLDIVCTAATVHTPFLCDCDVCGSERGRESQSSCVTATWVRGRDHIVHKS